MERPTPEQVLAWIGAAGAPWFPSRHADASGVPRDALDPPLNELRAAELVRVVDWIRGVGQGYALTADGEAAATGKPRPIEPPPANDPLPDDPPDVPPVVTPALVYANLLWYFVGVVAAGRLGLGIKSFLADGDRSVAMRLGAVAPNELLAGEWWRLGTSCFVHGSIWHVLVNVVSLVMVGAVAEHLWGRWRTFLLYLVSGFAGSCLAMGLRPMDPNTHYSVTLVGASGALCGLAMAVFAWVIVNLRRLEPAVAADLLRRLGFGILLSLAVSLLPGVSWESHLGGAAAGFVLAILLHESQTRSGWRRAGAILTTAALPAACALGLLLAMKHAPSWAPYRVPPPVPVRPDPWPYLESLRPEAVKPRTDAAGLLLITNPKNWNPERAQSVRKGIGELWIQTVEALKRLEEPDSDPKAKAFAEARRQSLSKLLSWLDEKRLPTVAEWDEFGRLTADANRLWADLKK